MTTLAVVSVVAALGVGLRAGSARGVLVAAAEATSATTTSTVADTPVSAAATTTTTIPCMVTLPIVHPDQPTTLHVGNDNNGWPYEVPVGTVLDVRLTHGDACAGPYWTQPSAQPESVVRQVPGTSIGIGATAFGAFEVIGPGEGTIVFPGGCGPLLTCQHGDFTIRIKARVNPAPPTTTPPTTLPPAVRHLPATT